MRYLIVDNGRAIAHWSEEDRTDIMISPVFRTVDGVDKLQFLAHVRYRSFQDHAYFNTLKAAKAWAEQKVS